MKLSKEDCASILALRGNVNFQKFMGRLAEEAGDKVDTIISKPLENTPLHIMRGEVRMLIAINNAVAAADVTLEQFENQN